MKQYLALVMALVMALAMAPDVALAQGGTPISQFPAASNPTGAEIIPIVQGGATRRITLQQALSLNPASLVPTPNYVGSAADSYQIQVAGTLASPMTTAGPVAVWQKASSASAFNAAAALATKVSTSANARATAFYSEAIDPVGGTTSFVEGARHQATLTGGTLGSAYGQICAAGTAASGVTSHAYLIGCEGEVDDQIGPDAPSYSAFNSSSFTAAFVGTNGVGSGTRHVADAVVVANPNSIGQFQTAVLGTSALKSAIVAAATGTSVPNALDLHLGTYSYSGLWLPNATPIRLENAAGTAGLNVAYVDTNNVLQLGQDAASVNASVLATGGTTARTLSAHFADVVYMRDRGAKCDGSTDDASAIQTVLTGLTSNTALVFPAGTCVFKTPLTIPGGVNNLTIVGAGYYSTVLQYAGTNTTSDIITVGTPGSTSLSASNYNVGMHISQLRLTSQTAMTAGAAIDLWHVVRSNIDPVIDGQDGTGKFFNGMWCNECDIVTVPYVDMSASNSIFMDNGSKTTEPWYPNYVGELRLGKGKIAPANGTSAAIGIHMAGGVGGLSCDAVDVIGSNHNLVVDNAVSGTGNQGAYFGPACYFDSSTSDNILINDTQTSTGPGGDRQFSFWGPIASCAFSGTTASCLNIQSWPSGIINLSGHVADAGSDGIKYQDASTSLVIGAATFIDTNKNYGIESTVASPKISFSSPVFGNNVVGDFNANVMGSTLPIYSGQYPCTAAFAFGGAAVGTTYTTQKCEYSLDGYSVKMSLQLFLSAVGSSTGTATITGLPVAGTTARDAGGGMPQYMTNFASTVTSPIMLHVGAGNSYIDLYSISSSGGSFGLTNSHFTGTSSLAAQVSYLRTGSN